VPDWYGPVGPAQTLAQADVLFGGRAGEPGKRSARVRHRGRGPQADPPGQLVVYVALVAEGRRCGNLTARRLVQLSARIIHETVGSVPQAGFEPATYCLEGSRSSPLSYWGNGPGPPAGASE
jgi:hypothetical protein